MDTPLEGFEGALRHLTVPQVHHRRLGGLWTSAGDAVVAAEALKRSALCDAESPTHMAVFTSTINSGKNGFQELSKNHDNRMENSYFRKYDLRHSSVMNHFFEVPVTQRTRQNSVKMTEKFDYAEDGVLNETIGH